MPVLLPGARIASVMVKVSVQENTGTFRAMDKPVWADEGVNTPFCIVGSRVKIPFRRWPAVWEHTRISWHVIWCFVYKLKVLIRAGLQRSAIVERLGELGHLAVTYPPMIYLQATAS